MKEQKMKTANTISIYEGEVPLHLEPELDRLYGSLFSSFSYFRNVDYLSELNTYVSSNHGGIQAIFLFTINKGMLRVANEGMHLQSKEVSEFARFAFERYPAVSAITFHAVQINGDDIPYLQQGFFCVEDFIAELPDSPEAYTSVLGGSTRKTIKWSKNRVERVFPSFSFQMLEGEKVTDEDIRALVEMKEARMSTKDKVSHIDEQKEQTILQLTRTCGALCTITIDGKLCAGTTAFRVGDNVYSWLNSHDPEYDNYRLGTLCNYLSICAFIERGAKRFHFGHTRYDYKIALLGKFQPYEHLVLYRSPVHFLLNFPHALNVAMYGYRIMMQRKLLEGANTQSGLHWKMARMGLETWRNIRKKFPHDVMRPCKTSPLDTP